MTVNDGAAAEIMIGSLWAYNYSCGNNNNAYLISIWKQASVRIGDGVRTRYRYQQQSRNVW